MSDLIERPTDAADPTYPDAERCAQTLEACEDDLLTEAQFVRWQGQEIERLTAENEKLSLALEVQPGPVNMEDVEWAGKAHLTAALRERDELRGLIDAHNADCIARCEAMSTQAGHAGVCSHYTNLGRTCPNCPRDEMIAQADAAMGLPRPAEE